MATGVPDSEKEICEASCACRVDAYMPTMVTASPFVPSASVGNWRDTAHSGFAADEWRRLCPRTSWLPRSFRELFNSLRNSFSQRINRKSESFAEPRTKLNPAINWVRAFLTDDAQHLASLKLYATVGANRWSDAHYHGHFYVARRAAERTLDRLFAEFSACGGAAHNQQLIERLREVLADARGAVRYRSAVVGATSVPSTRDWTQLFSIHTGCSPPSNRFIRKEELVHGGFDEEYHRSGTGADHGNWPQCACSTGDSKSLSLDGLVASRGESMVHHRQICRSRKIGSWPVRGVSRWALGHHIFVGLRCKSGVPLETRSIHLRRTG
jgi:hypothetical protein